MAFKYFAVLSLVAIASGGVVPDLYHSAPVTVVKTAAPVAYAAPTQHVVKAVPAAYAAQPVLVKASEEYDPHPQYKYGYNVQDSVSGDSKSQVEERDGDVVRGEYSLIDADGYKRTVQYTSDPVNGFNAVVNREPLVKTVKTVAAPVAYAAPTVLKTVTPVAHYTAPTVVKSVAPVAPVAYTSHIAPVSHYAAPAVVKTVVPAYATSADHY